MTHLFAFDPSYLSCVRVVVERGSGFSLSRIYSHPTKGHLSILEIISDASWQALDLDANSGSSPLLHLSRKPVDLGNGMAVERFEEIYGATIGRPRE